MTYIQPLLSILILVFGYAAYRAWRSSKEKWPILLGLAVLGLFFISWQPFARILLRPYENRFPPRPIPPGDAQAIVLISGAMEAPSPVTGERSVGEDTYARCLYAAWLYKRWRQLPVLASGGPPRNRPREAPDAIVMQKALERAGVPATDIWCESRSVSTRENALYSAQFLRGKGIHQVVLVTSAYQMLRAVLCFRKEGLAVTPAACDYHTIGPYRVQDLFPSWEGLRITETALHETIGIAWYWAHGWV
ncbi:MAG TPA: YdcF family protein [Terriglobia bacterium]|nr:YdcF family protein [Terriglobia bacterium]